MFHRFRRAESESGWQGALTACEFERILRYVGLDNILSPKEWLTRLETNALLETDVCITFDDGLRCQSEIALPVLERLGLRAFWFVYSSPLEGRPFKSEVYSYIAGRTGGMQGVISDFLARCPNGVLSQLSSNDFSIYRESIRRAAPFYTESDIKYRYLRNQPRNHEIYENLMDQIAMERGFNIEDVAADLWLDNSVLLDLGNKGHIVGLHSYDHPYDLSTLPMDEQQKQYEKNHSHLLRVTGSAPKCMSHPLNSYNRDTLSVLRALGVVCGFRANMLPPPQGTINASNLELAREDSSNLLSMLNRVT